ncbi:hypothetical protein [Sphingomonas sp. Leaf205]|uniref:hypothetical protein n=1 Tax=Sphingomonas sp. Leaf205 TaxID=2876551 RepID=UPI001E4DC671|nr:hypothetical protein [Sphingomonas sp. Leaf205]
MAGEEFVRPSRDGDQFHYYWAARQCLRLLPPGTTLVAISIEGPAIPDGKLLDDGAKSIDVAEYHGSTVPATATHIRYVQLKHSSRRADKEWLASELTDTLQDFGERYVALVGIFGTDDVAERFSFEFVSNRPLAASLVGGLDELRGDGATVKAKAAAHAMRLPIGQAAALARILTLTGRTERYLEQRSLLHGDVSSYLPEADRDAPLQMKNLVEQRATTEFEHRPEITRMDVLKALGTDMRDLYPAPPLIDLPSTIVPRTQLAVLADRVIAGGDLTIIEAHAGVGKSVLSTQLGLHLPDGSRTLVYDCFGNGAYRSASGYRHRCRDGLVQLANELAGLSLSDPLIPTSKADPAAYVRAFLSRVEQAAGRLAEQSPAAILCIVIDAADNAQIAADEVHEGSSFPRLLLREAWPSNVRIVLTARPHRVDLLDPPSTVSRLELESFSEAETGSHLRSCFPGASEQNVHEFHRQTSMNPRVQATALAQRVPIGEMLLGLAGAPRTVEHLIGDLLENAIAKVVSDAPKTEREQIDQVCTALATLRPFVPLDVVARVADVPIALVTSLANDLQRPLIVREGAIQFRDEPTETWFRRRFRPAGGQLDVFITRLLPAADTSAYVAAGLPQLLLEAGRFDDLVHLALSDDALPAEPAMARRDVALQRLQFALKAAIRGKRHLEATKLALKAGGETAADARQQKLISANTDLARHFLEPDQMLEQVSRRLITGGDWTGSEHAYEAAFLSGVPELAGDALSRLRVAYDWLKHWSRRPGDKSGKPQSVGDADIAELALADLNLQGVMACAKSLRRWRSRERSFGAGRQLCSRLIDAGRFEEVADLAIAAGNDLGLLLAVTMELAVVGRLPPKAAAARTTRLVTSRHVRIREPTRLGGEILVLAAVNDVVAAAVRLRLAPRRVLANTLSRYMPSTPSLLTGHSATYQNRRAIQLRAVCLRAALRNETVTVGKLRPDSMKRRGGGRRTAKDRRGSRYRADSGEIIRFEEETGSLLPWHLLSAEACLGRIATGNLERRIDEAASSAARHRTYDEDRTTSDEIAMLWSGLAYAASDPSRVLADLDEWRRKLRRSLFIPTLLAIARRAGRSIGCEKTCLTFAQSAFEIMAAERADAQGIADVFVDVARAVLVTSLPEAREYFEQAIEVSGKIGDENVARWEALSDLAVSAGQDREDRAELAYRYSRVAELVFAYTEHFDWDYSMKAIADLSAPSGPTILSRWIDRRFAHEPDALASLVEAMDGNDGIDPRDAISLMPIDARWPRRKLLHRALEVSEDLEERKRITTLFVQYARHSHLDSREWREIAALFHEHGVDSGEAMGLARAIEKRDKEKRGVRSSPRRPERVSRKVVQVDWDAIFAGVQLTQTGDLATAHTRFRSGDPPFSSELFYAEAVRRLPPGREAGFITAMDASAFASLYDARQLLDAVPDGWSRSPAVRRAVGRYLRNLARRESDWITTSRIYPPLRWERVEAFGLTRIDIFREAVAAIGDTSLPVEHVELFALASLLSTMIDPEEAADALGYGLGLMEPLLLEGDDGPWRRALEPAGTVAAAIAGYVWAALASPWAERRWKAAHSVCAMCASGRSEVLTHLLSLAESGTGGPFAAPDLTFYSLHARFWLVIALARAAPEHPSAIVGFADLLKNAASINSPHVLIRHFAASAVGSLIASGQIAGGPYDLDRLSNVNVSSVVPNARRSGRRGAKWSLRTNGFLFGHDFVDSWLSPLASCFDIAQADVERDMIATIRKLWGPDEDGSYTRDKRALGQQFKDDGTYRLQSHWPKVDDQGFYQSSHALMMAAGRLLDHVPLATTLDDPDPMNRWLDQHRLSLPNGVWLADRRDDRPSGLWVDLPTVTGGDSFDDAQVLRMLKGPDGLMHASADWEVHRGTMRQHVQINSVLVTADRSGDLARALQSADDHDDYRLPTSDADGDEILEGDWAIRGWLRSDERERRLDRHDPWAGGLHAQIPAPGESALAAMGVSGDEVERLWHDARGRVRLRAEVWSDGGDDDDDRVRDRGRRLLATRGALDRLMERTGKHLLFEVRLQVERVETRHTRYMEKEAFDDVRITRYVVVRLGHPAEAAPGNARTRKGSRRRTGPSSIQ